MFEAVNSIHKIWKKNKIIIFFFRRDIKTAYYLPVRINVDKETFCLYPKAMKEDDWQEVCGPQDDKCYFPRPDEWSRKSEMLDSSFQWKWFGYSHSPRLHTQVKIDIYEHGFNIEL